MTKREFIRWAESIGFAKHTPSEYDRYNYSPDVCIIFMRGNIVRLYGTEWLRARNECIDFTNYAIAKKQLQVHLVMDT